MENLSTDNLWLFAILFLPGFISVKIDRAFNASIEYDWSKNLFEIFGYSLVNLLLFSWLIMLNIYNDWIFTRPIVFYFSILSIFFIAPILWPIIIEFLLKRKLLRRFVVSSTKSAWDYIFQKRKGEWIIIHLKDGRKIGGKYGVNSYASPYPC